MATAPAAARGPATVMAALATDRPSAVWSIRWWLIRPPWPAATRVRDYHHGQPVERRVRDPVDRAWPALAPA